MPDVPDLLDDDLADVAWAPPAEFDGYRVERLLGEGAMGRVYLATDTLLERPVAIKFLRHRYFTESMRSRFLAEARALARLQHPNVVGVYRAGEVQGRPYLASEFVRGEGLDRAERPLPSARVLEIGLGLARGLSAAHRQRVLHKDVKPANVLVADGEVKLVDFGLAQLVSENAPAAPARELPAGTPAYMAPEIWEGERGSFRSDVYSAGAVLYELLVGHAPHMDGEIAELCLEIAQLGAERVLALRPDADPSLAAVVERCLEVDPALRYASGEELLGALEALRASTRAAPVPSGNPYRGLHAFEAEHRAFFFGREAETREILDRVRHEAFVLVAADSGVGKSSLCRAGVLPEAAAGALDPERTWSVTTLTPGEHPLVALVAALSAALGIPEDALAARVREDVPSVARELRAALGRGRGLILFIDQLEELVTLSRPEEAALVGELLGWVCASTGGIRVLGTARSDFLTRISGLPGIGHAVNRALYLLKPLNLASIREAIVGPARVKGVTFESDAMVERLAAAVATTPGGLPLLQFALAELWDQRPASQAVISESSLEALGGVTGALARHADRVVEDMRPAQRAAARRLLPELVTVDGTRARRGEADLLGEDAAAPEVLDMLVRARLLVAREGDAGSEFEVAHEALIHGWPTLSRWLAEDQEQREAKDRLRKAAADWVRLGRTPQALWSRAQLREVAFVDLRGLRPEQLAFLTASRARVRNVRRAGVAAVAVLMLAAASTVGWLRHQAQSHVRQKVLAQVGEAQGLLAHGRALRADAERGRTRALALFDAEQRADAEAAWRDVLAHEAQANTRYAAATRALEVAFMLDRDAEGVHAQIREVLFERATFAALFHRGERRREAEDRLSLYDLDGEVGQRLRAPAALSVDSDAAGATVSVQRVVPSESGPWRAEAVGTVHQAAATLPLEPGSWIVQVQAPGRIPARIPVLLSSGERRSLRVALAEKERVPEGYIYVPGGPASYGSSADEAMRRDFFGAAPLHERMTPGFVIAQNEVTYADYLAFLRTLPADERQRHTPVVNGGEGRGSMRLAQASDGTWQLSLRPTDHPFFAREGERFRYAERELRKDQEWLRFPVSGVSAEDALAYTGWLDRTGRLPGARLCSELEWERAARGADGREYPHGDFLLPSQANVDATYGKRPASFGPDEVGSHPMSRSPFGVDDLAGNVWEWTRTVDGQAFAIRGGCFYNGVKSARSANREIVEPSLRDMCVGIRVCADAPVGQQRAPMGDSRPPAADRNIAN